MCTVFGKDVTNPVVRFKNRSQCFRALNINVLMLTGGGKKWYSIVKAMNRNGGEADGTKCIYIIFAMIMDGKKMCTVIEAIGDF